MEIYSERRSSGDRPKLLRNISEVNKNFSITMTGKFYKL